MYAALLRTLNVRRDSAEESDEGFTLIELLIVIVIIGILAAIAIPTFLGQQNAARDGVVTSDLGAAKVALVSHTTLNNNKLGDATVLTAARLTELGFTKSAQTTNFQVKGLATAATFCIQGTSETGKTFSITNATTTFSQVACPETPAAILTIP